MKKLLKNNADKILAATLAAAFILIIIAVKSGFTVSFAENAIMLWTDSVQSWTA